MDFDEADDDDLEDFGADFGEDEDDSGEEGTSGVCRGVSCLCLCGQHASAVLCSSLALKCTRAYRE